MSTTPSAFSPVERHVIGWLDRLIYALSRHWVAVFGILLGVMVWLPISAPVLMRLGWAGPARAIYFLYSFLCHQLPERSFFLFGPQWMVPLSEIQAAWVNTDNPLVLRQFLGSAQLGWKVAWSDRMVAMYASTWIAGLLWRPFFRRLRPLPIWGFLLLLLPMFLDGASHTISDLAGIGQGFRDQNAWLALLTGNGLPAWFYAGDALGSFNSWMRLITGLLFGLGVVWYGFPYLEANFQEIRQVLDKRFQPGEILPVIERNEDQTERFLP